VRDRRARLPIHCPSGGKTRKSRGGWIPRVDGFLILRVENNNFQVWFFDQEKELIETEAARAAIRYYSRRDQQRRNILQLLPFKRRMRYP